MEKICLQGLDPDYCERKAQNDLDDAAQNGFDVTMEYKHQRSSGECPCMASWVAIYKSGFRRV